MSIALKRRGVLGVVLVVAPLVAVRAQSLKEIDEREAAVLDAWDKTPLTVRRAFFVAEKAAGFGMAEERPSKVFKPGEPLVCYVEPVAYGFKSAGGGAYDFGFDIDAVLTGSPKAEELMSKKDFLHIRQHSRVKNRELFLTLTLNLTGAPAGDFVLEWTLRDIAGPKEAKVSLPFSIRA